VVYRRSARLVAYWRRDEFVVHPYRQGPALVADAALAGILSWFSTWRTAAAFAAAVDADDARRIQPLLRRLVTAGILERAAKPIDPPPSVWDQWGDAAAFLHFTTRDHRFEKREQTRRRLVARAAESPPAESTKRYAGRQRVMLPTVSTQARFGDLLRRRRTWRQFGQGCPTLRDVAAVLGLTFRLQRWVDLGPSGRAMLRSSPSGGARHPTEAYVLVRRIEGLPPGAYYYAPAEHALVRLRRRRFSEADFTRLLGGQFWYGAANVLVCMTSAFERTAWVYRSARVYKSLLLEAGHFCQTLCLAATARRLAPFCTGAFAATRIEKILDLEADVESVMYIAGFGTRPPGVQWAPLPAGKQGLLE
jgi:SagB-type dehydrogenase family enzyme